MIKFFDFLINSNLFISLCSTSLFLFYTLKSNQNFYITTMFLVFGATFLGYHMLRFVPLIKGFYVEGEIKSFYKKNSLSCIILAILSLIFVIFGIAKLDDFNILLLMCGATLLILYEKIIFHDFELRKIPYIKPFIIAAVWTIIATCLNSEIDKYDILDCYIFILLLSIPFDIKDLKADKSQNLITFPMLLKEKLNILLIFCYLIFASINFFYTLESFILVSFVIYAFLIHYSKKYKRLYYLGFDGLIIARFLVYLCQN